MVAAEACCGYFLFAAEAAVRAALEDKEPIYKQECLSMAVDGRGIQFALLTMISSGGATAKMTKTQSTFRTVGLACRSRPTRSGLLRGKEQAVSIFVRIIAYLRRNGENDCN